ncbi:hypothetical protein KM043_002267 [Ampulex compressa]|nr:hypothetical protein KM043_002267 [Ampulex compressa]
MVGRCLVCPRLISTWGLSSGAAAFDPLYCSPPPPSSGVTDSPPGPTPAPTLEDPGGSAQSSRISTETSRWNEFRDFTETHLGGRECDEGWI